ncbi:MAG TPA: spermidine synthase, partial [Polyangia bacterium]|nr:spermidine synthase [Polyangia bacterium]
AGLYAANTLGAVGGVLGAAFFLVPALGLRGTALACAALNALCAGLARAAFADSAIAAEAPAALAIAPAPGRAARALLRLAATGLLGIGYEVLAVRVLSQVEENTVYTFAVLLAVYLVGTAGGAAAYHHWRRARGDRTDGPTDASTGDRLLATLAAACLAGTATLWWADRARAAVASSLGGGVAAAILGEALPALLAFGPAAVVMGALFCHLAREADQAGVVFGRALGANTAAATAAPAFFGVLAVPAVGPKPALLAIAAGYLALVAPRAWRRPFVWAPAALLIGMAALAPALAFVDVPPGGRVLRYQDGVLAAVSVVEDAGGVARLRIDNRQQEGSSATVRVDGRQAWLPLLLHAAPRSALFLGLGTGVTATIAAADPTLAVDAVELLPEVIAASPLFAQRIPGGDAAASRLAVHQADARRYVRASDRRFDVIVSDNFHPARSGSGSLYTVEHFAAVRGRLAPGGLFCQWLPLHQLDNQTLRSIVRSYLAVFPRGSALLASNSLETPVLGLLGRADDGLFDTAAIRRRLGAAAARADLLAQLGLEDELAVLGSFVGGPAALRRLAAGAPANTDDRPIVAYRAPAITYAPATLPRDRLIDLLRALSIDPDELLASPLDPAWARRLTSYWTARARFVEAGRDVRPLPDARAMLAQVAEPLLAVLRISPDFRPAYDPLLAMATALARSDARGARTLLSELAHLQPARAEASRALADLDDGARVAAAAAAR